MAAAIFSDPFDALSPVEEERSPISHPSKDVPNSKATAYFASNKLAPSLMNFSSPISPSPITNLTADFDVNFHLGNSPISKSPRKCLLKKLAAATDDPSPQRNNHDAHPMQIDMKPFLDKTSVTHSSSDPASSPSNSPLIRKKITDLAENNTFKVPQLSSIKGTSFRRTLAPLEASLNTRNRLNNPTKSLINNNTGVKSFGALGARRPNGNSVRMTSAPGSLLPGTLNHWSSRGRQMENSVLKPVPEMRKVKSFVEIGNKRCTSYMLNDYSSPGTSPSPLSGGNDDLCSSPTPVPPTLRPASSYDDSFKRPRRSSSRSSGGSPSHSPRAPKFRRTVSLCETAEEFMSSLGDNPRKVAEQERTATKVAASMRIAIQGPRHHYNTDKVNDKSMVKTNLTNVFTGIPKSPGTCLPYLPGKANDPIKRITIDTLHKMLSGQWDNICDRFLILDCRFPYEYEGGHIDGAVNCSTVEQIETMYKDGMPSIRKRDGKVMSGGKVILVFHCEYSVHRAPRMALHLRQLDRTHNLSRYPYLDYPEVYVLQGGYNNFFKNQDHREQWCKPQAYVEMRDSLYKDQLAFHLNEYKNGSNSITTGLELDPTGSSYIRTMCGGGLVRKGMWGRTRSFTYGEHMKRNSRLS